MKVDLDITIKRFDFVGKACPSLVTIRVWSNNHIIQELRFRGMENVDYLINLGVYSGHISMSPKFKKKSVYIDVPGRTGIMFHVGNSPSDSRGCILLGLDAPTNCIISESTKAFLLVDAILNTFDIESVIVSVDDDLPF